MYYIYTEGEVNVCLHAGELNAQVLLCISSNTGNNLDQLAPLLNFSDSDEL